MCRAEDLSVPPFVTYVAVQYNTNNLYHNEPKVLVNAFINAIRKIFNIVLNGPLPRDSHKLRLTYEIIEVNNFLKKVL